MRKFQIGFYRSDIPTPLIVSKLQELSAQARPRDRTRTASIDEDTVVLLRNITLDTGDDYLLDFSRLSNTESQMLSDLDGNEECLSFGPGKRPAFFTVCMYNPVTRVVAIHETQPGISASMLVKYWMKLIPHNPRFSFDPILETAAQERILRSGMISKFTVSLASMGNSRELAQQGFSDEEIMRLSSYYLAPSLSVTLKAGREPNSSLNLQKIRELLGDLFKLPRKNVKRLSITAADDVGDLQVVDLLRCRLVERVDTCSKSEETHDSRYRAIREGWGNRKNELLGRYIGAD